MLHFWITRSRRLPRNKFHRRHAQFSRKRKFLCDRDAFPRAPWLKTTIAPPRSRRARSCILCNRSRSILGDGSNSHAPRLPSIHTAAKSCARRGRRIFILWRPDPAPSGERTYWSGVPAHPVQTRTSSEVRSATDDSARAAHVK